MGVGKFCTRYIRQVLWGNGLQISSSHFDLPIVHAAFHYITVLNESDKETEKGSESDTLESQTKPATLCPLPFTAVENSGISSLTC